MDIDDASRRLLEAGKSEALIEAFRAVADSTGPDGEPRYSRRVVQALARAISCRAYGRAVFELCHLVNAADALGEGRDRWERFFFTPPRASAGGFRAYVDAALARRDWRRDGFRRTAEAVALDYGGSAFVVRFARMPFLAALLEFLLTSLGYAEVDAVLQAMLAGPPDEAAVGRAASGLQALLYRHLAEHLPSVQNMAKFARLMRFLRERAAAGGEAVLDDAAVLDFWQQAAVEPEGDFRAYRTVFEAVVQLVRALEAAVDREAMARARPIGPDRAAGEVDPEAIAALLEAQGESWESPLAALAAPPADAVKFLTKTEQELVELLCECGPLARRLPRSLLRAETFGRHQARITQALRRREDPAAFGGLLRAPPEESYAARVERLQALRQHIARLLFAAAHVLLGDAAAGDVRLQAVQAEGRRAFRQISRRGFEAEAAADPERIEAYRVGVGALTAVDEQIAGLLERVSGEAAPALAPLFEADARLFANAFVRLYEVQT